MKAGLVGNLGEHRVEMWHHLKLGEITIEYNAEATRERYSAVEGSIAHCACPYCENYRLVREAIYPSEFLALLVQLGVDYRKETELTHHFGEDENVHFGHSADGHYALVGRVLDGAQGAARELTGPFEFWIDANAQSPSGGVSGNEATAVHLHFFVSEIPQAKAATKP